MKTIYTGKLLIVLMVLLTAISMAQAQSPHKMSYQAVIRDGAGELVVNSNIGVQISILQGSTEGAAVFVERHFPATNENGLVSLETGSGTVVSGSMEAVDWSDGPYFIKTETDLQGGSNYTIAYVSELLSVPYALHATTAETLSQEIIETDPVFMDSPAAGILLEDIDNWDEAFSWGDHGEEGYLQEETDPLFSAWDKSEGISITESQISDLGEYLEEEVDPLFTASPASGILSGDIENWDEAFSWGDHGEEGYVKSETDPLFTAWDKSEGISITESQISDLGEYLEEEVDPLFTASPASGIQSGDIENWDAAFDWGNHADAEYISEETQTLADVAALDNSVNAQIKDLTDPTDPQDAATKAYVDLLKDYIDILTERIEALEIETGMIIKDIDGNTYRIVTIGDQIWMAENLRVTRYNNGDDMPTGLNDVEWQTTTSGAYAIYPHGYIDGLNSDEEVVAAYGKLYNWYAVYDDRGLCPEGWSVPSHDDWTQLEQYICNALGNSDCEDHFPYDYTTTGRRGTNEGNALKSCRQIGSPLEGCNTSEHPRWNSHSTNYGFDEFGFSALPGSTRCTPGYYGNIGLCGWWWSSSEDSSTDGWFRYICSNVGDVNRFTIFKTDGFSVRCVRDISEVPNLYNLQLEAHPEEAGIVTVAGQYQEGDQASITATPNPGWTFVNWTGDIANINDPALADATATMPAQDISITANFQEDDSDIIYGDGVTDIDGNDYVTVIIGDQEWMAENLRVSRYNNEDDILTGLSNDVWSVTTAGAYAIHPHASIDGLDSDAEVVAAYGKLYNWYAVDDARVLCPAGWSVPGDDDWTVLVNYVVAQGYPNDMLNPSGAGNALKSCRQVNSPQGGDCNTAEHPRWDSNETHHGFDVFGFSALPGGIRNSWGVTSGIGFDGKWWSSSEVLSDFASNWDIIVFWGSVDWSNHSKRYGFSVRCFREVED